MKYTPEGTPITLSARVHNQQFEIAVPDEGPGLAPGDESRVFDKFYRARREWSQSGVGLGLTICRAIVEAHGGRIWAEPNPTPIEYRLLGALIRNADKVVTQRQLLKDVWGPAYVERSHYLCVHMAALRQKLELDPARPRFLLTESGVGYRFATDDTATD